MQKKVFIHYFYCLYSNCNESIIQSAYTIMSGYQSTKWSRGSGFRKPHRRPRQDNQQPSNHYYPKTAEKEETYNKSEENNIYCSSEDDELINEKKMAQKHGSEVKDAKEENSGSGDIQNQEAQYLDQANSLPIKNLDVAKSAHLSTICLGFLEQIQNLEYSTLTYYELQYKFKQIVAGHITFNEIYPQADSSLGLILLSNGIFHEMWGTILKKSSQNRNFWVYYQKFEQQIEQNHTAFQSMFNYSNSMSVELPQDLGKADLQTNLSRQKSEFSFFQIRQQPNQSSQDKEMLELSMNENLSPPSSNANVEFDQNGRIRLFGQIQNNQRRLNAEIVCFFLNIKQAYKLENVHISAILETQFTTKNQIVVLQGQVESYCQQLKKIVLDYRPKTLLIAYGDVNLGTLLRLRLTYGDIQGLVVYDELIQIQRWLKANWALEQGEP